MQLIGRHRISGAPSPAMTVSTALCRARSGQGNGHPFSRLQAGWRSIRGTLACQAAAPLVTRLLSKYLRLPSADEPPAEEPDEPPDDNDDCNGDPRDGASGEPAPVGATAILYEVAEYRSFIVKWRSAV